MASASRTTDHETIQRWVEARGGHPAHVKRGSSAQDPGILRIDYPGYSGAQSLEPLDWDTWFDAFEANGLAFLYQDERDSRFSKLVRRTNTPTNTSRPSPTSAASGARARRRAWT